MSGQLPGGFAEPFHCFQILPHGFHGKRVRLLSGGQLVDLPLPCLRGDCLAAVFQFFQIPGCCVIQDQFPAVALLKLFPLFRLYFGKLLVDGLVLVVLFPHLSALGKGGDPALGLDDLSPQVIVMTCLLYTSKVTNVLFLFRKTFRNAIRYNFPPLLPL